MRKLIDLQTSVAELLAVAGKIQDRQNTRVYVSLEDFRAQKHYIYCSKPVWQRFLNLKTEGKRFIELSKEEYYTIKQRQIEL